MSEAQSSSQQPAGPQDSESAQVKELSGFQPQSGFAGRRPEMENLTNRQLGEFHLLRRLGRGGMADIYLAEQTSLNRRVAVKVLRPDLQADETHRKRFQREAIAAGGLNHPNIVQVYGISEAEGYHFIAEEYVQGFNLREYLNRKGPPDVPLALHIMKQVVSALAAAAEAGIVHRDIKPENILLTRRGEVKVADFGLAQLNEPSDAVQLTQDGMTMGTPLYMSPEQISGRPLDCRSDIYSFGVTCYHMLSGRPPFHGKTGLLVASLHLSQEPEPLERLRSDLPAELCAFVRKAMAKKPEDRFFDPPAMLAELRQISKLLQTPRTGEFAVDPSPSAAGQRKLQGSENWMERFSRQSPGRRAAIVVGSLVLAAGLGAAAGWWMRPGNPLGPDRAAEVRGEDGGGASG